jgi:hypothetical protein
MTGIERMGHFEAARRGISLITLFLEEEGTVNLGEWLERPDVRAIIGPDLVGLGGLLMAAIGLATIAGREHGIEDEDVDVLIRWALQELGRSIATQQDDQEP